MTVCQVCGKPNMDDARFCFSCGTALSQSPPVKVEVKSPLSGYPAMTAPMTPMVPPTYTPRQTTRQGSCYYHADLPSSFICSRCGRSICAACARQYGVLNFCTQCFFGLSSKIGYGQNQPQPSQYPFVYQYPQQEQTRSLF